MLALLMAKGYYMHDDWKVLVIDTSEGQLTFHVPPDFDTMSLPELDASVWDGHSTEVKWERVKNLVKSQDKKLVWVLVPESGTILRCEEISMELYFTDVVHKSEKGIFEIINDYPLIAELDDKKHVIQGVEIQEE